MTLEAYVGLLALAALVAYGILGGADFGGGIWDLLARGPRKAAQREAVARAMGPVWEANHVWLVFVVVLLFAGFPAAYAALSISLFVPFHLVLLGIILRGAAFVFRAYAPRNHGQVPRSGRRWGAVFGAASVITPLVLGMSLGAVSSDAAWHSPLSWSVGLLTVAMCAYLAAVFLANETRGALREDFRRRALWSGTAVVALSAGLLPLLWADAPHLWRGLVGGPGTPALVLGALAALASGWWLRTRRHRLARAASVVQVAMLLLGWGLAQFPYLIYPTLTLSAAAAPPVTLRFLLWSTPFGMALLLPSLWLLFRVFKGEHMGSLGAP